jgi:hypothetical protein
MLRQIARPIGSIGLVSMVLASGVSGGVSANTALAADCLTAPNSPTPEGSHWYYRMDWPNQRKCWYLRAAGQPSHQVVTDPTSETLPPAPLQSTPILSATTSGAASPATVKSRATGADTPPMLNAKMPSIKQQPTPTISATTNAQVPPGAEESAAPASSRAVPPQSNSSQTSAQSVGSAPAAARVWPDPPTAVAAPAETESIFVLANARADSIRPKVDTGAPEDRETTARRPVPTSGTGTARPPTVAPMEVLLTLALGLAVAGILSRFALKIAAARRGRIIIDHRRSNWIDDQQRCEGRDKQNQHGFADNGRWGDFIDDKLEDKLESDWISNFPIESDRPPGTQPSDITFQLTKSLSPRADDLEATRRTIMRALQCTEAA